MSAGKLPEGWVGPQLDEIATDINYGYTASSTSENIGPKMLRITDIQDNKVDWNSVPFCKIEDNQKNKYLLCNGDLVFARTGATVGKSFLINEDISNIVFASYLIRVRCNKKINSHYLSYFFRSPTYWSQITEFSAGIGQPNVNGSKLKKLNLPLTSVYEQKIIAEKLDTLLAQVDSTKARLEQIPQILKRFRQAVLNSSIALNSQESKIKLAELTSKIGSGSTPKGGNNNYKSDGVPFVRSLNIHTHFIKYGDLAYIDNEQANKLNNVVIREKDVLLNITGASIGRVNIAPDIFVGGRVNQHVAIIRCQQSKILPEYLHVYMASPKVQKWIQGENYGATRQALTKKMLEELLIIVPPLPEQQEIVRRVEQLFAYADTIEKQVNNALTRVNSLTQSILAKAFRGELTAQWRAENPSLISGENSAAALLEKIKAERAASGGKKTSRKKA
ncbi:restriction endonuclease subunit S [Salmonella enterica subsp. salamae]|nr:restriction endonuclease subunit S [Salmonella enterica subsp. salamae]EDW4472996.1 restriction endonuclease subunit S [Salmonella enterica subsp. salamae]